MRFSLLRALELLENVATDPRFRTQPPVKMVKTVAVECVINALVGFYYDDNALVGILDLNTP